MPSSLRLSVTSLRAVTEREGAGARHHLLGIGGKIEGGELGRRIGRDADAADPWRDEAVAAFDPAGPGIGR